MKHTFLSRMAGTAAMVLILGAGCATAEPQAKDADTDTSSAEQKQADETQTKTDAVVNDTTTVNPSLDLALTAQAQGGGKVALTWTVGDDTAKTAEAYRIVMSKNENPDWDHKSYWYERNKTARDKTLENMPLGTQHFRVCAVVGGTCSGYSNDVSVDVK